VFTARYGLDLHTNFRLISMFRGLPKVFTGSYFQCASVNSKEMHASYDAFSLSVLLHSIRGNVHDP
jgi:hypothetical protein